MDSAILIRFQKEGLQDTILPRKQSSQILPTGGLASEQWCGMPPARNMCLVPLQKDPLGVTSSACYPGYVCAFPGTGRNCGCNAFIQATIRADGLRNKGDRDGHAAWLRVKAAMLEMLKPSV